METEIKRVMQPNEQLIEYLFTESGTAYERLNMNFFHNHRNILLVAYCKETPSGFLYAYMIEPMHVARPKMFLYSIDVFPLYQNLGIGSALIEELKIISKQYDCKEIFVLTNDSNHKAKGLYDKTGATSTNNDVMYVYKL